MPASSSHRLTPGAVLAVPVGPQLGLVQYIGEHPELGGCVWVVPRAFASLPADLGDALRDGYCAFIPARAARRRKLADVVGQADLAGRAVPIVTRRAGARAADGTVLTWVIEGPDGSVVRERLSDAERALPVAGVWNVEFLAERIATGWRPETD
jgi:hypothetical protein